VIVRSPSPSLHRCDGCGEVTPDDRLSAIRRLHAPGTLFLCTACWQCCRQACKYGGSWNLGELIEELAAHRYG